MAWQSTKDIVQEQIEEFQVYADTAYNTTLDALREIADSYRSTIEDVGVSNGGGGNADPDAWADYEKPAPPESPVIVFSPPEAPGDPTAAADAEGLADRVANRFAGITAPVFTDSPLPIRLPDPPSDAYPDAPSDPAPLNPPTYPAAPTLTNPTEPSLREITIPKSPEIDLDPITTLIEELRASKPVAPDLPVVPGIGELMDDGYRLANDKFLEFVGNCPALAKICPRLGELLSGHSTGLTAEVAQALRDRAFSAEYRQATQAEQEALTDWLARGFTLPGSALESKLATIRQLNRDKIAALNRDLWIEEAKMEIENLRFAIQQGIAYEGMLRDAWIKLYGIVMAMAQAEIDAALKTLDAALNLYRIKVEAWQTEFSTIKDQLQIELSKLEVFKAELEAQRLIGQLNQQDIELYKERWNALNIAVSLYKTQVDAANSILQGELAKLEYSAKQVQIYLAKITANESQWKSYGIAADAEKTKADLFESQSRAFSARVSSYATSIDAAKTISDTEVSALRLMLEAWQSQLEKYKAELQTELGRIDALVRASGVDTDIFKSEVMSETGYSDAIAKRLGYYLDVRRSNADIEIKNKDLVQSRELYLARLTQDSLDGIARIGAQLSGSAMSAMSIHSGISSSSGYSESHSYNETG